MKTDLLLHWLVGFLIGTVTNMFVIHFGDSHMIWIGAITSFITGAGKELVWDKWMGRGTPQWDDFMLTCLGGATALFVDFVKLI